MAKGVLGGCWPRHGYLGVPRLLLSHWICLSFVPVDMFLKVWGLYTLFIINAGIWSCTPFPRSLGCRHWAVGQVPFPSNTRGFHVFPCVGLSHLTIPLGGEGQRLHPTPQVPECGRAEAQEVLRLPRKVEARDHAVL